jgi:LysM repeat protein
MQKKYTSIAKSRATSETSKEANARQCEIEQKVTKGTFVMSEGEWNSLHPAMIEFITDLTYQGGTYGWDRVAKINKALKDNLGDNLKQFKAVRELFTGSYMDDYFESIRLKKSTSNATENFYGQEMALKGHMRRNLVRLAYLDKVISALESSKIVEVVDKKVEVSSTNTTANNPVNTQVPTNVPELSVPATFKSTYTVKKGEGLYILAAKFGITIDQLKMANADKLKTWGNIQGFNESEIIRVPAIVKKNEQKDIGTHKTPGENISSLYKSYTDGAIGMPDFARGLLPYVKTNVNDIIALFDKLGWSARDNFAYALAANSNDSSLSAFDKHLLNIMSEALDSFLTLSRDENLKQKERIDKCLGKNKPLEKEKPKAEDNGKTVNNKAGRDEAIKFVEDNKYAYLKGREKWLSGKRNNKAYNNILMVKKDIPQANNQNLKVYRNFSGGVYTYIDKETLDDTQYTTEISNTVKNTYCNIAATKIGLSYNAPNLQNHKGAEHSANDIYIKLSEKFYDSDTHQFKNVTFTEAEQYANAGGLAYAVYKASSGSGHIATLTGGYGKDGSAKMGNLNIFQAGSSFGAMVYSQGFGDIVSLFYIWVKK